MLSRIRQTFDHFQNSHNPNTTYLYFHQFLSYNTFLQWHRRHHQTYNHPLQQYHNHQRTLKTRPCTAPQDIQLKLLYKPRPKAISYCHFKFIKTQSCFIVELKIICAHYNATKFQHNLRQNTIIGKIAIEIAISG